LAPHGVVVELEPVPLDLLARRVLDVHVRSPVRRRTCLAMRAQFPVAELAGERRIRPVIPQRHDLVEEDRGPHMLIINKPLTHVRLEPIERIRTGLLTHPGLAFAVQIGPHRLAVMAHMPGNGRDRPPPLLQRCHLHIVLWCQHRDGAPLAGGQVSQPTA